MTPEQRRATALALTRAGDTIERYGHLRGEFGNRQRGFCIAGAVMEVTRDWRIRTMALSAIRQTLGLPHSWGYLYLWSDNPDRTKRDLLLALARARRIVRQGAPA